MEATASLNNLWSQILALPASDRQWLRDNASPPSRDELTILLTHKPQNNMKPNARGRFTPPDF